MMHLDGYWLAVGSTTTKANEFYESNFVNAQASDTNGAVISLYDNQKLMYATLFATISVTEVVSGFKSIRMDTGLNKALAVLETNNDQNGLNIYLVSFTLGGDL